LLFDNVNAVHARLRYFRGGEPAFRKAFLRNAEERVRTMLRHLTDSRISRFQRMHDCIFDPAYKLDNLSRSGVQELYAWLSHDGTPICNSRTERVLRWFGYDVVVHD
jgi:hypothetical protein